MNHTYEETGCALECGRDPQAPEHLHDHDHACGHNHNHDHDGHAAAEKLAAGMFVLSRVRRFNGPVAVAALQEKLRRLFLSLAEKAAVEDLIPGHLKGAVKASGGETLGISVTRPDTVDFAPSSGWEQLTVLDRYTLTVNVMLLSESKIRERDLFAGLTQRGKD